MTRRGSGRLRTLLTRSGRRDARRQLVRDVMAEAGEVVAPVAIQAARAAAPTLLLGAAAAVALGVLAALVVVSLPHFRHASP